MRIGIVSDIHANAVALSAVLSALRREAVDQIVCLGDVASDGPQPRQVLQMIEQSRCPVIMGNADAELLGLEPQSADPAMKQFNIASQWCASVLTGSDRIFLESFAPRLRLDVDGVSLSLFHGSPKSYNDQIYPTTSDEALRAFLVDHPASLHVGGHTHFQMFRRIDASVFVNPGSAGMAYDRTRGSAGRIRFAAWAEYAILQIDSLGWDVSLRRVGFDIEAFTAAIQASGMPNPEWWTSAWRASATIAES